MGLGGGGGPGWGGHGHGFTRFPSWSVWGGAKVKCGWVGLGGGGGSGWGGHVPIAPWSGCKVWVRLGG